MARDGDGLQGLSAMMGAITRDLSTINLTLDNVPQELKRLSLKMDGQRLANDICTEADGIIHQQIFYHHIHPYLHHNQPLRSMIGV